MSVVATVTWYVARDYQGRFNRGRRWVDDIARARLHRKIGPCKSAVTKWVKANPGLPIPDILEWRLDIATATVLDVAGETQKRIVNSQKVKLRREAAQNARLLECRRQDAQRLQAEIARLEGKA